MGIKVSIIVPVYNAEKYIHSTMEMLCQSYLNEIEIVAVNDGSNDGSLEALRECARIDSRIKVVDKPNGGIADARNRGLVEASGEYVCFCDQDDVVEPEMYDVMYRKAKEKQLDVIICSVGWIVNGEKIPDAMGYKYNEAIVEGDMVKDYFLAAIFGGSDICSMSDNPRIGLSIWNYMISHQFIEHNDLHFRSYVNFEDDRLFALDVLAYAEKFGLIPEVYYYWRLNESSESHSFKYIENLYKKDIELQEAQIKIMRTAGCSENDICAFENYNSATRYAKLVENEACNKEKRKKERINAISIIYSEEGFRRKIKFAKHLTKGLIERKIICKLLEWHMTVLAYGFAKMWHDLRCQYQSSVIWTGIQRKLAKKDSQAGK